MRHLALLLLGLILWGCAAAAHYDNPLGVMQNRDMPPSHRLAAARQAEAQGPTDPERLKTLNDWLWTRGQPAELRKYAIDQLIRYDQENFRHNLPRNIITLSNWEVLQYLFDRAVALQWKDFTPAAVRSWTRPAQGVTDDRRAERKVIAALNPGRPVEEVVFEVFANADGTLSVEQQTAAWELLNRLVRRGELLDQLRAAASKSALVMDLQVCARDLGTIPVNKEGVLWLSHLRAPERQAFWTAATARVKQLDAAQHAGLELRHLAVLVQASPETLRLSRAQLWAEVGGMVNVAEHHLHSPTMDGQDKDYPQSLAEWGDKLCWGDLLCIRTIAQALREPAVRAEFFRQADLDHADPSTEYGGVLDFAAPGGGGMFTPVLYKPMIRQFDTKYIPDQKLFERLYTALAHYHFHVQNYKNKDFAGPGMGDLRMADNMPANFIVLTFVAEDKLNVDYYQAGRVVVDLGTLYR